MALGMGNVEGIFYLLVMGVILAIIIAIFDVLWESKKRSIENEVCRKELYYNLSALPLYC